MAASGLEAAFMIHRPALLRYLKVRGAGDEAEDLLQELWMKARAAPPGERHQALPYLYRMAHNLMLDQRRTAIRRTRRELDYGTDGGGGDGAADSRPDMERVLIARDMLARVDGVLRALGPRTDQIFRRFRLDGVGQKAIAEEQGISVSAVEKHLQRAYRAVLDARRTTVAEARGARAATREQTDGEA